MDRFFLAAGSISAAGGGLGITDFIPNPRHQTDQLHLYDEFGERCLKPARMAAHLRSGMGSKETLSFLALPTDQLGKEPHCAPRIRNSDLIFQLKGYRLYLQHQLSQH